MDELKRLLSSGDAEGLTGEVKRLLDSGTKAGEILNDGLIATMAVIGERFKKNEIFIPEVLVSADAMQAATKLLEPYLAESGIKPAGRVLVGTVKGDLHDIGKNLVCMMLKGAGFEVEDCGIDVSAEKFIESIKSSGAQVLALSSLLTTSMPAMKETIEGLKANDMRDKIKVMVGGAPITKGFADQIGADGYGKDAAEAVDLAKEFLKIEVK